MSTRTSVTSTTAPYAVAAMLVSVVLLQGLFLGVSAAETKFYTKLKSGGKPILVIAGNSTSQEASVIPNKCNTTDYVKWPGQLKTALTKVGAFTFNGTTCAGRNSENYGGVWSGSEQAFSKGLAWTAALKPDAVIVEFAVGADCVARFDMTVAESRAQHEKILAELRKTNPACELFIWTGARSWGTKWTDRLSRPSSKESQPDYAKMCVDFAAKAGPGVYVVDTYPKFMEIYTTKGETYYKGYVPDMNHTNAKAATEIVVPEFMKVLQNGNGATTSVARTGVAGSSSVIAGPVSSVFPRTVYLPKGVTGVELYSISGKILFRAENVGSPAAGRTVAVPGTTASSGTVITKYITL